MSQNSPVVSDRTALYGRFKKLHLAVLSALVMASGAHAAGFGKLTVLSSLGQPFRGEIELNAVSPEDQGNLTVKLASLATYKKANIEVSPAILSLQFVLDQQGARKVIKISSNQPINDPYIDLLVELGGTKTRVVREYTVLLDPAEIRTTQGAVVASGSPVTSRPLSDRSSAASNRPFTAISSGTPAVSPTASNKPVARSSESSDSGKGSTDAHTDQIQKGETLRQVASRNLSGSISLDQMLIAMYRANKGAFIDNNINRIRAGTVLNVPSASEAQGISVAEARSQLQIQTRDFNNYRNTLAAKAETSPAEPTAPSQQTGAGRIGAVVKDSANSGATPTDRLKLSRGAPGAAAGANAVGTAGGNDVANEAKIRDLQRNIDELKKLLDVQNQYLASLKKEPAAPGAATAPAVPVKPATTAAASASAASAAVTTAPAPAATPATSVTAPAMPAVAPGTAQNTAAGTVAPMTPPPSVTGGAPAAAGAQSAASTPNTTPSSAMQKPSEAPATGEAAASQASASASSEAASAASPAEAPVVTPKAPPTATTSEQSSGSFISSPAAKGLGGLLVILLAGFGFYRIRQKRKEDELLATQLGSSTTMSPPLQANSLFASTGGQDVDTKNSMFNSAFVPNLNHIDTNVDPIAEADVYIAYGRDAQAEEILKEALRSQPSRDAIRVKLLEIYAIRKDYRSFEIMAGELYSLTRGEGPDWDAAAAIGAKIDADNPLYVGGNVSAQVLERADAMTAPTQVFSESQLSELRDDLDYDSLGEHTQPFQEEQHATHAAAEDESVSPVTKGGSNLDFDVDGGGEAERQQDTVFLHPNSADAHSLKENLEFEKNHGHEAAEAAQDSHSIDFDHNTPHLASTTAAAPAALDMDLSGFDLDLPAKSANAEHGHEDSAATEIETKLDLASAYQEIGDTEGARELLIEIMRSGSPKQVSAAQAMLEKLD